MSNLDDRIQAAGRSLVVDVDSADTERALLSFDARLRKRRRRKVAAGAVVATAMGGALAFFAMQPRVENVTVAPLIAREAPQPDPQKEPDAPEANRVVYFSDGSHAELILPRTELRMEAFSEDLLELTLAAGEAQFDVVPSSRRLFRVRTRDMRIEVLGTSFTVASDEDNAMEQVTVHRGRVAVHLGDNRHELSEGMRLTWDGERAIIDAPTDETTSDVEEDDSVREDPAPSAPPKRTKKRKRRRRAVARHVAPSRAPEVPETRWKRLAQDGNFDAAYVELNAAPAQTKSDPRELMLAADVARLSGHPNDAVRYLEKVTKGHRGDHRALLAAFTLGRILQRELDEPRRAAEAFRTARELGPTGSLAEDALAHEAECWARAGDQRQATALADEYLRLHPEGRKVRTMRRLRGAN